MVRLRSKLLRNENIQTTSIEPITDRFTQVPDPIDSWKCISKMSPYDCKVNNSYGELVDLGKYRGHVTLIVNTSCVDDDAKNCYELLASIYRKYKDDDLSVLLFPCSQFGSKTSASKELQFLQRSNIINVGTMFQEVEVRIIIIGSYAISKSLFFACSPG